MTKKGIEQSALREFVGSVRDLASKKDPDKRYLTGTVTHTDLDGTVWVNVSGGVSAMPVSRSTASYSPGDLVSFSIENGVASMGGNVTDPAVGGDQVIHVTKHVDNVEENVQIVQNVIADKASIGDLQAVNAEIDNLKAKDAEFDSAIAKKLEADDLKAVNADIGTLKSTKADIAALNAETARVDNLLAGYTKTDQLEATYAKIDLANVTNAWMENGVIKDAAISDAQIIGVSANKMTTGTLDASKVDVTNLNAKNINVEKINGVKVTGKSVADALAAAEGEIDGLSEDISDLDSKYAGYVADLNARVDAQIETWTAKAVPTLNNYPASSWNTAKLRDEHVGDICYVVNAGNEADGYTYRFAYDDTSSSYGWVLIKDNQVTKALQDLLTAQGDISNLQDFQSETSHWIDETDEGITEVRMQHNELKTVVDKTVKASTQLWHTKNGTALPTAPKAKVTDTSTAGNAWRAVVPAYSASCPNYFYCWQYEYADGTFGWSAVVRDVAMEESQSTARTAASDASTAKSNADSKARNFTSQPKPPYSVGDTWTEGSAGDVKVCKTARASGNYTASDWVLASKYTDDTKADAAASAASAADTKAANAATAAATADGKAVTAQNTANANIKSSVMLWYTSNSTTPPTKPYADDSASYVSSTSTDAGAWTTVVPTYASGTPNYHYCYQQQRGDGKYQWTAPVYDQATSEAMKKAQAALPASEFKTFQSDTFKKVVDEVNESSTTITNLTESVRYGGRNLAKGTTDEYTQTTLKGSTNECPKLFGPEFVDIPASGVKAGEVLTISFDIKLENVVAVSGKTGVVNVQGSDNNGASWHSMFSGGTNGGTCAADIKALMPSGEARLSTYLTVYAGQLDGTYTGKLHSNIRFDNYTGNVYIRRVKVERGPFATPWEYAAEDVTTMSNTVNSVKQTATENKASIESLSKTVTANETVIEKKYSTLSQTLDGLSSTVGATIEESVTGPNLLTGNALNPNSWTISAPAGAGYAKAAYGTAGTKVSFATVSGYENLYSPAIAVTSGHTYTLTVEYTVGKEYTISNVAKPGYGLGVYRGTAFPGSSYDGSLASFLGKALFIQSATSKAWTATCTFTATSDSIVLMLNGGMIADSQTGLSFTLDKLKLVENVSSRLSTAETAIEQTANNVLIKATKSDTTAAQGAKSLIQSLINVAPEGVKISADKVDIEGAAIFTSGRLSSSTLDGKYDAKGAASTALTDAKKYADGISIGSRNLLIGSMDVSTQVGEFGWKTNGNLAEDPKKVYVQGVGECIYFKKDTTSNAYVPSIATRNVALVEWGKEYVYGIDLKFDKEIKVGASIPNHYHAGCNSNGGYFDTSVNTGTGLAQVGNINVPVNTVIPANTWTHFEHRFKWNDTANSTYPYAAFRPFVFGSCLTTAAASVQGWMRNAYLIEADSFGKTTWSPAPEEEAKPNLAPFFSFEPYNVTAGQGGVHWNSFSVGTYTPMGDGWAKIVTGDNTSGTAIVYNQHRPKAYSQLSPDTLYTLVIEFRNVSKTGNVYLRCPDGGQTSNTYANIFTDGIAATSIDTPVQNGVYHKVIRTAVSSQANYGTFFGLCTRVDAGAKATYEVRLSIFEGVYYGPYRAYDGNITSQEQRIYYRSDSATAPAAPTAWVTSTAASNATWSAKRMPIEVNSSGAKTAYVYIWTCMQRKRLDGLVTCTQPLLDDSTTVIDGGNIITGSVAANSINARSGHFDVANIPDLDAKKITSGYISADRIQASSLTLGHVGGLEDTLSSLDDELDTKAETADVDGLTDDLKQLGDNMDARFKVIGEDIERAGRANQYVHFEEDVGLMLGESGSDVTHVLTNSRDSFRYKGEEVAAVGVDDDGAGALVIANASVSDKIGFGKFAWVVRNGGQNVSFKWNGE